MASWLRNWSGHEMKCQPVLFTFQNGGFDPIWTSGLLDMDSTRGGVLSFGTENTQECHLSHLMVLC